MQIRSKGEIAALYMPDSSMEVARAYLSAWIKHNDDLSSDLKAAGYKPRAKLLTPKQIRIIYHYLGNPCDNE